jgi:hypothetical protein
MGHWDYEITAYYNSRGAAPGRVAMITTHRGEASRDIELAAFRSRDDIGEIKVRDLRLTKAQPNAQ